MAERRVFGTICDGDIEFVSFSEDDWEGAKIVLAKFLENESICIGTEISLPESHEARNEMIARTLAVAKDGCSILARVVATGQIVGCAFNKIQYKSGERQFTQETCQTESLKAFMQCVIELNAMFNIYEYYDTNCLYKIVYVATLPEFSRRNIALEIIKHSIQIAKELKHKGEHLKFVPDELKDKRPAAVISTFSSKYSQRIGDKLGMEVHAIAYHKDFVYKGKNYMERILDPTQNKSTIVSLKL